MSKPSYEVKIGKTDGGNAYVSGIAALGIGEGLPEDFGKDGGLEAERNERRLQRIEAYLGLDPITQ
ncbi:hypothetical protein [Pseudomonas oryzihabitans]|uniref:hypothetical protein n=1 Tax=Pseudomonas oryzihabitans TaxID=47885 RepID=UPI003EBD5740